MQLYLLGLTKILFVFFSSKMKLIFEILFRTDWLYSQKYDRGNVNMKRSIPLPISQSIVNNEDESAA